MVFSLSHQLFAFKRLAFERRVFMRPFAYHTTLGCLLVDWYVKEYVLKSKNTMEKRFLVFGQCKLHPLARYHSIGECCVPCIGQCLVRVLWRRRFIPTGSAYVEVASSDQALSSLSPYNTLPMVEVLITLLF